MTIPITRCPWSILILSLVVQPLSAQNWTQWRGPDGQGHARTTDLPLTWSETENIAWKTELPGLGWSSPVVFGDQVWVTTAETVAASEEERAARMETVTNSQPVEIVRQVNLFAVCLDKHTGAVLHHVLLMTDDHPDPIHVDNSYATPTPVIEAGRLYCHFGTHGTACLQTDTASVLWTNQTLRLNHENGPGSSPVLFDNLLIFHCDGSDVQYIVALDKHTGEIAWRADRSGQLHDNPQLKKSYCTPLVVEIEGTPVLISPAADWIYGYDPATGQERWKVAYGELGFSNSARPVFGNDTLYVCTGFMQSRLLALQCSKSRKPPTIDWVFNKQVPRVASPLLVNDLLFFISDQGVATCLDARNGELYWQERIGGNHWASPFYAEGNIFFTDKQGRTTIVAADKQFNIVSRNQLDGVIMASAAAVEGALFLRTDKALYRIQQSN